MNKGKKPSSGWPLFRREFSNRAISPFKQPTYFWYFLASMGAGTIGIWMTVGEGLLFSTVDPSTSNSLSGDKVFRSILTFFAALGSASCARIVMIEDKAKHLRSFFVFLLLMFFFFAIATFAVGTTDPIAGLNMAIGGAVVAIITWWMANWDEDAYGQETDAAPLGGNPEAEAAGETGDYRT